MTDEPISFKEKIRSLQFIAGGRTPDKRVADGFKDGHRIKTTTEGDPRNGTVTHIEHAVGDRVDATVSPATLSMGLTVTNQKG